MVDAVRYSETLTMRCAPEVMTLVDQAARARGSKPSEYVRQALQTALRLDGFDPAGVPARDAGTLYNVVSGRRAYALVSGDRIVTIGYHAGDLPPLSMFAEGEGDRVLPVEYVDSEPFDIARHWRLPPVDRLEADRVVREFQIVPKSWESM